MRESIVDPEKNLELNRNRWGDADAWDERDDFGYRWAGGVQQTVSGFAKFCDHYLRPFTENRYDHTVLEIAPGGGRFTAELIRYANTIDILDMTAAGLDMASNDSSTCQRLFGRSRMTVRTARCWGTTSTA